MFFIALGTEHVLQNLGLTDWSMDNENALTLKWLYAGANKSGNITAKLSEIVEGISL